MSLLDHLEDFCDKLLELPRQQRALLSLGIFFVLIVVLNYFSKRTLIRKMNNTYRITYIYYCDSFSSRCNDYLVDASSPEEAIKITDSKLYQPRLPREVLDFEQVEWWNGTRWEIVYP